ncbi:MAG: integrase family protein [Xanthobacteraceae bacterium]|jgi:integrase
MRKLTAAAIERIKPPARGQVDHFDKGYPGFGLRCSYRGAKTFVHVYRLHGKLHRVTLGRWPAMPLAKAREAWRLGREALDKGEDPAFSLPKPPDTFAVVADEWLRRDQAGNRTVADVARIIAREVTPAWGDRLITTVNRRDVLELVDGVADRGHPIAARRLHAHLHRLFRWSVGRGILERNPMAELPKPGDAVRRDRVLGDAEIATVWKACAAIGAGEQSGVPAGWPFGLIIRLLLLTGARRDEIGALRWSEIVGDEIRLAGVRTKNGEPHNVPLSAAAAELIGTLPRVGESDYVFTTTGETHVTGWSKAKRLLDEAAAQINGTPLAGVRGRYTADDADAHTKHADTATKKKIWAEIANQALQDGKSDEAAVAEANEAVAKMPAPWRIHDLRRTVATGMQRLGVSLQVIEAVLGHVSGSRAGIVGVYQRHAFDAEKRDALEKWSTEIERILGEKPTTAQPANVVVLPKRAATKA